MPSIVDHAARIAVVTPKGDHLFFENLLESLTVEELDGELAQRLSCSVVNDRVAQKRMAQYLANGSEIRYFAGHKRPLDEQFRGRIFRNSSSWGLGPQHEITAYDPLFYLQQSQDDRYYSAGKTGEQIIRDIARAWGIPVKKLNGPNEKLSKKAFPGKSLAEMIGATLAETRKKGGGKWIARMDGGKLETVRRASNKRPFVFRAEDMAELNEDRSIENLVTVAKIVGRDKSGSKTLGTAEGLTKYGKLQRIINRTDFETPAATKKAAIQLIRNEGREIRVRTFAAPDIPALRKGDLVVARARTLDDQYIVRSVVHDPLSRTMFLDVIDPDELERIVVEFEASGLYTWEPPEPQTSDGGRAGGGDQSKAGYQWPVGGPITSPFGPRGGRMHEGIDIGASTGTAIAPTKPGRVTMAAPLGEYGNLIIVDHGGGVTSRYAHLSSYSVRAGASVGYSTKLGAVGATGNATGPHLHFEIRIGGGAVDPMGYMP